MCVAHSCNSALPRVSRRRWPRLARLHNRQMNADIDPESAAGVENPSRFLDPFADVRDRSVELLLVDLLQDFADPRARLEAKLQQMPSQEQRRRWLMLDAQSPGAFDEPIHCRAVERSGS